MHSTFTGPGRKTVSRRRFMVSAAAVGTTVIASAIHLDGGVKNASADTGLADVTITGFHPLTGITEGDLVTFGAHVQNVGTAATPSGVPINVTFSIDGVHVTKSTGDTTSLAVGGAGVGIYADGGNASGGGTWTATAGDHTLVALVNDGEQFPESNYSNNQSSTTFTVAAGPTSVPVNTGAPVISGDATVGDTLTVTDGTWS